MMDITDRDGSVRYCINCKGRARSAAIIRIGIKRWVWMKDENAFERIPGLDALRGAAVLLMIGQHAGFWLWDMDGSGAFIADLFYDHPFLVGFNALGGLAAPLFIMLAGAGADFFLSGRGGLPRTIITRGVLVMIFGFCLNLAARGWLTAGSWYVLHLIGLGLVVSPALARIGTVRLVALAFAVLFAAPALQQALGTPLLIGDDVMTNDSLPWGPARLALVEGHFPVFPWMFLFISGMACGRWALAGRGKPIAAYALACLAGGASLAAAGIIAEAAGVLLPFGRAFYPSPVFYPAMPPITLALAAVSSGLFLAALAADRAFGPADTNVFVCLGRSSFTLLLAHIAALCWLTGPLGIYQSLGARATGLATAGALAAAALFARLWRGAGYRFGAEWLVRKISG